MRMAVFTLLYERNASKPFTALIALLEGIGSICHDAHRDEDEQHHPFDETAEEGEEGSARDISPTRGSRSRGGSVVGHVRSGHRDDVVVVCVSERVSEDLVGQATEALTVNIASVG